MICALALQLEFNRVKVIGKGIRIAFMIFLELVEQESVKL